MGSDGGVRPLQNTKPRGLELVSPVELYRLQKLEQSLNRAILKADIRFGSEHFVTGFNMFYDEQLEVSNNGGPPLKGNQANLQKLLSFLTPIHVVVEVGAAELHCFEMEESWIEPDGSCMSTWHVDITGPDDSGRRDLRWVTKRRWKGDRVVFEEHTEGEGIHLVSAKRSKDD